MSRYAAALACVILGASVVGFALGQVSAWDLLGVALLASLTMLNAYADHVADRETSNG